MNKEEKGKTVKTAEEAIKEPRDNAAELSAGYIGTELSGYEAENFCAASATECTGLIQVPPEDEDEYEAYNEVYGFAPQTAPPQREQ